MSDISNQQRAAYTGLRDDVFNLIVGNPVRVLDVGCSNGTLLKLLKRQQNVKLAVGIELDPDLAEEAKQWADEVIISDLDGFKISQLEERQIDLIVLADVLEHTKNPQAVLQEILGAASKEAQIIISLPNIQHWTAIKNLLIGKWPQRERGLFDKTHLRFFTFESIQDLAESCGLVIEEVSRNYRITDAPDGRLNRFSRFLAFWPLRPFVTYQYVLRLRFKRR